MGGETGPMQGTWFFVTVFIERRGRIGGQRQRVDFGGIVEIVLKVETVALRMNAALRQKVQEICRSGSKDRIMVAGGRQSQA